MDTIDSLTAEYQARIAESPEYRPNMSADDALYEVLARRDRYDREATYLREFITRWEKAETAEREQREERNRFEAWRTSRVWFHDLRDSEATEDAARGPGYCYQDGSWILLNTGPQQSIGRYWTLCPFDVWGDLDTVEHALWDNHANAEERALNR